MMRRSPMKQSSKPLARTPFRSKPKAPRAVAPKQVTSYSGRTFSRKAPKKRAGHNKKMLNACAGQRCYLMIPGVCCGRIDTVVPAHSNEQEHGKGMGIKAHDQYTVPACYLCHAQLDQGTMFSFEEKRHFWRSAYSEWAPERERLFGLPYTELAA